MAQSQLTGVVIDSVSSQPLARANVMLQRSGRTVKFVRTGADGSFSIMANRGDSLSVTFLGYAKKVVAATNNDAARIRMVPSDFVLNEVSIKAGRVFAKQDTISFSLSDYASQRDNSLKDVLKKLPGVDIADNGQISFNGKAINRFTVESLDLTGGRYNKITDLLKAKDVDRAEVIEHDQPVRALRNKVFTDNVALNIKLKAEARDRWLITLRPGAVVQFPLEQTRPQGGADAMQIGKQKQRMYDVRYDRSGRDLTSDDSILAFGGTTGYGNGEDVPEWFSQPSLSTPIDAERLRMNRSWDMGVKEVRRRGEEGERRITAGYYHTNESQQTGNSSTYYFDPDEPESTDETSDKLMKNDRLYMDFTQSTNDSTAYSKEYFLLEGTRKDGLSQLRSDALGIVAQRVTSPQLRVNNTYSRTWPTPRRAIAVESVVDFRHAPMKMTVDGDVSRLYTTLFHTDEAVSLTLYRPFLTHRYTARVKAEHINVNGGNTLVAMTAQPWWQYKNRKLRATLNVPIEWNIYTRQDKQLLDYSPSVFFNFQARNRHELWGTLGYTKSTGGWSQFLLDEYSSNYRTLVRHNGVIPRTGNLYATVSYDYKRTLAEFFSSFSLSANRTWANMMTEMTIDDGRYVLNSVAHNNITNSVSANATVSKGIFSWHTKLKLGLNYSYVEGSQLSSSALSDYSANVLTATPSITFSPSFGTFEYSGRFTLNAMKTEGVAQQTLLGWTQRGSYTHSIGKIDLSVAAVHYRNELQSCSKINTFLLDGSAVWRLRKLRLSLSARNLLNKRDYTVTTYSGVLSSTSWYKLRPRELVLDVQVSL